MVSLEDADYEHMDLEEADREHSDQTKELKTVRRKAIPKDKKPFITNS